MYQKINLNDFLAVIIKRIEGQTGLRCYDTVPENAPSPFYFVEVTGVRPSDTKTSFRDVISVNIHAIAAPGFSSVEVNNLINAIWEAMSMDIELPEPFYLNMQISNGVTNIKTDETNEKHAIMPYDFTISYGFKCK